MIEGITTGFVIAPFDMNENSAKTITNLNSAEWRDFYKLLDSIDVHNPEYDMPRQSTTIEQHRESVETIIRELRGAEGEKTIAAKIICRAETLDAKRSFESLATCLPDAFVFLFYTPSSGAWLGASPELLLKADGGIVEAYALAGTRQANENTPWDWKNIKEQQIVSNYILNYFFKNGLYPEISETRTHRAGSVEHLLTEIKAAAPTSFANISETEANSRILDFIKGLSPTPALCGMPRAESMDRIQRIEKFQRGYYGGFCGPYTNASKFAFYVNIRSLRFDNSSFCVFAGGGITPLSNPDEEWQETERKANSILSLIKIKEK